MTYQEIRDNEEINTYIRQADMSLSALGYTEHSFAHVTTVAEKAGYILQTLGYEKRLVELAKIAGYLHDIGNLVNREEHSQSGAIIAFRILDHLDFPPEEVGLIVTAIGNHDEGTGVPVSPLAAALILADKSDIKLKLSVDTRYGSVMDYFEIFMQRMILCRKAAEKLGLQFKLMINEQQLI